MLEAQEVDCSVQEVDYSKEEEVQEQVILIGGLCVCSVPLEITVILTMSCLAALA